MDNQDPVWERSSLGDDIRMRADRWNAAFYSPDGRSVLLRAENDTVNVFAAKNGQLLAREQKVREALFTADGAAVIVGSNEGWVRIRELHATGPQLSETRVPPGIGTVNAVAFSPDGRWVVLGGSEGSQLCHPETWEPIGKVLPHEWPVSAVAFSPDSQMLVTSLLGARKSLYSTHPGKLQFWNVATGEPISEPIELAGSAWSLAFDTIGETLLAGPWLWHMKTRELTANDPFDPKGTTRSVAHLCSRFPRLYPNCGMKASRN